MALALALALSLCLQNGHLAVRVPSLAQAHEDIGAANLDVLLWLDVTMSTWAHRVAMARLAPVQALSHGKP